MGKSAGVINIPTHDRIMEIIEESGDLPSAATFILDELRQLNAHAELRQQGKVIDIEREAQRLIDSGYRGVSNRYRLAKRIDRPDWLAHMAYSHTAGFPGSDMKNFQEGVEWVTGLGEDACADHYRRCYSRDEIEVSQEIYDLIRKAGNGHGWGGCAKYLPLIEK